MARNRFFTDDNAKWFGPTHIGPSKSGSSDIMGGGPKFFGGATSIDIESNREKRITKFIFDGPDGSPVAKLRDAYRLAVEAPRGLWAKREELEGYVTAHVNFRDVKMKIPERAQYTPLGLSEKLAEEAVIGEIPAVRRARAVVEKVKADIVDRRSKLTLAKPTDEQRRDHDEIRVAMRAMTTEQREAFVEANRQNPVVVGAIVHASVAGLTGLDTTTHQNIVDEQREREHGDTMGELRDLEEVVKVVDKVTSLARKELKEIISTNRFEDIARIGEAADGELPFRTEERVVDGQRVMVGRVWDQGSKTWRDASAEELQKVAA